MTTTSLKQKKLEIIYGAEIASKISNAKVLVVGAGGIGCELVKVLSMTGFAQLAVIDLDTIDISNLNRQFLFRRCHVDMPKSKTLKESICSQNSRIVIDDYVGRIQENRFGYTFFKQFSLVINALDNDEARNFVNSMCFNLDIPLVEAGTNGYEATCVAIKRGMTQCYQCADRIKEKSFPVCTIRQRPEKLIHCIVWAKALFEGVYGGNDGQSQVFEDIIEELDSARKENDHASFIEILFDRVFHKEPQSLIDAHQSRIDKSETAIEPEELKETEAFLKKITPLKLANFKSDKEQHFPLDYKEYQLCETAKESTVALPIEKWVALLASTMLKISEQRPPGQSITFDKDDPLAMDFVTAATNIRAHNFQIPTETLFKVKEMAGKIVPAISSSNALVAALQVIEAVKLLSGDTKKDQLKGISYMRMGGDKRLSSLSRVNEQPKPDCVTCSNDTNSIAVVTIGSFDETKLSDFVDSILPDCLSVSKEGDLLIDFDGKIIYERCSDMSDDELQVYQRKMAKSLTQLGLESFSTLMIQGDIKAADPANGDEQQQSGATLQVQLVSDTEIKKGSPWTASYLKRGVAPQKKPDGAAETAITTTEESKAVCAGDPKTTMEIEDDEVTLVDKDGDAVTKTTASAASVAAAIVATDQALEVGVKRSSQNENNNDLGKGIDASADGIQAKRQKV